VLLDGVGAGLVEGIYRLEVEGDLARGKGVERHVGGFRETPTPPVGSGDETHGRDYLMRFAGQARQERGGFATGSWLPENADAEGYLGVRAEDEGIRKAEGNGLGFGGGVGEADFAWGEMGMVRGVFGHIGDIDLEGDVELAKEFASPG